LAKYGDLKKIFHYDEATLGPSPPPPPPFSGGKKGGLEDT